MILNNLNGCPESNQLCLETKEKRELVENKQLHEMVEKSQQFIELPEHLKNEKKIITTFVLFEKNRHFINEGKLGRVSKNHIGIKKIKFEESGFTVAYDEKLGEISFLTSKLGNGSFKVVKKVIKWEKDGVREKVVAKIRNKNMASWEIFVMDKCKKMPNVIQLERSSLYTSKTKGETQIIETKFFNMGTLKENLNKLNELENYTVASKIINGIIQLHEKFIIHRDIKPANIFMHKELVNGKETLDVVVADLGLACFQFEKVLDSSGTPFYLPFEILFCKEKPDFDTDIYGLGVTLYELKYGRYPFAKEQDNVENWNLLDLKKALIEDQKKEEPLDKNSMDFIIWNFTQFDRKKRMNLSLGKALNIIDEKIKSFI